MGNEALNNAISAYGGVTHFRDLLGYDPLLKPDGYWTEENTLKELKNEIEKIGHFPTGTELHDLNRDYLNHAILINGGVYKFRKLLNFDIIKRPAGHWTYDTVVTELKEIITVVGDFPTREQLKELDKSELIGAMDKNGGSNIFREALGYELLQKPKGYWTEDMLVDELKLIIAKIGHFPTREELAGVDRQDVCGAFAVLGGSNKFRELLGYVLPMKPAGYWTEKVVIKELKKYINTNNYFPTMGELRHNSSLIAAIYKYGGAITS